MTTQTKADRQEAAQKAAATRKRNEKRQESSEQGRKAAASRFQNDAVEAAKRARKEVEGAFSSLGTAAKSAREAGFSAGKSVASRVGVGSKK